MRQKLYIKILIFRNSY